MPRRLLLILSLCCCCVVAHAAEDPEVFSEDDPPPAETEVKAPPSNTPGEERVDLESIFPPDKRIFGWTRMFEESSGFGAGQLELILGVGAELYLEYDVEEMRSLDYSLGEAEISIELFRTGRADGAFGLYTIFNNFVPEDAPPPVLTNVMAPREGEPPINKVGDVRVANEKLPPLVGDNYHVYPGQGAEFFKGRVYGRIHVFGDIDDTHMLALTIDMLNRIPRDAPRPPILRDLPKPGMLSNSERYVVGELSILELSFPVPPELWKLAGSARAASARYRFGTGTFYDLMVVKYGNPAWASSRFKAVSEFLSADGNFQGFSAPASIPQPFVIVKDTTTDTFIGLQQRNDLLLLYSGVANVGLFDRIATTNTQISVR